MNNTHYTHSDTQRRRAIDVATSVVLRTSRVYIENSDDGELGLERRVVVVVGRRSASHFRSSAAVQFHK